MTAAMPRRVDTVVIGAGTNGLVAAIGLARAGSKVLVIEASDAPGGALREIEFAPGFRASPVATDLGWIPRDVAIGTGIELAPAAGSDPSVVSLGDGEPLLLRRGAAATAEGLRRFSPKDAERWPRFAEQVATIAEFLGRLCRVPAPRIDADSIGEFLTLAKLGRGLRGLGKREMIEVLRTVPLSAAEWLDDWFESDRLKGALAALAVSEGTHGPMAGGTTFTFLHRHVGSEPGVLGERVRLQGGAAALIDQLAGRAKAAGAEIQTGAAVAAIVIRDGQVAGVRLGGGEEVECREVVSSLDPYRTLLELMDPVHLDPEFIHAVTNIRFRGATTRVLVALDALPSVPGLPSGAVPGALLIAPSIKYVERASDAVKYGRCSEEPVVEIRFPSLHDPGLAPSGKQVAVLQVQYTPYRPREGSWDRLGSEIGDRAMALVERYLPGFGAKVRERVVMSPVDLERRLGLREGASSQGELMLDQILFMRPVAGWSRYAMPVPGVFLCGTSTHPGPGVTGMSGWLAAQAVLSGRAGR
jgi:phytoene dehydrogenase-like protein